METRILIALQTTCSKPAKAEAASDYSLLATAYSLKIQLLITFRPSGRNIALN